jgi:SWI/SNF-related matrix-associated actin-dependent regulator 1 of chromatin subfamily A
VTVDLFPYQIEGAQFLASRERACLFDEMGVGKTAQAIRALDDTGSRRIVIVCPAVARQVWAGELKKFSRVQRKIAVGKNIQDLNLWLRGRLDVLVLSYEMATTWAKRIAGDLFDALVFDEAHYLKSPDAQRTRALLGAHCDGAHSMAMWAARVYFLTGTPLPNDAADVWSMMRFTGATRLTRKTFRDRYYKTRYTTYSEQHEPRPEMIGELRQVIQSVSLRRTAQDVDLQLPPIWFTTQTVDGDSEHVRALLAEHPGLEEAILEAVERGGLSFLDAQHISTLRRLVGEAKAPAYLDLLKEEFSNGLDKIVVFGIHQKAIQLIKDGLNQAGVVCLGGPGSVNPDDVARFEADPEAKAIALNLKAGGTAVTLVSASRLDMFESGWAPVDNWQPVKRIHRIGQRRSVNIRFISLAKSIDEQVNETVAWKTAQIGKVEGRAA